MIPSFTHSLNACTRLVGLALVCSAMFAAGCSSKQNDVGIRVDDSPCGAIEQWARYQRENRFADYSKMYSFANFTGIKKTRGNRQYNFDREKWLKDRRRTFKIGLGVYVEQCTSKDAEDDAVNVTFNQYWRAANGAYADQGLKTMRLVEGKEGYLITHEQMLSSKNWYGILPATQADASSYTISLDVRTGTKKFGEDMEEPQTTVVLRHGYEGGKQHATQIIQVPGGPMSPACEAKSLPYGCVTFYAGMSNSFSVTRKKNKVRVRNCWSDETSTRDQCETYATIGLPQGINLKFEAKSTKR